MAFLDRQAMTDKIDKPDIVDPVLATESTEATEPAEPMDRIEPAEPIDRIEPVEPIDRIDPLEPMLSNEPADPAEPAGRSEPEAPTGPPEPANDELRLVAMIAFLQHGHRPVPGQARCRSRHRAPGRARALLLAEKGPARRRGPLAGAARCLLGGRAPPPRRAPGRQAVIDGDRIVHEVRYAHPVHAVWQALTDPAELAAWLMLNDFAPQPGHRFRLDARPGFGIIDGEVIDVEPPHLLRCRWTVQGLPTTVTIRLRAGDDDGSTVLRLEHAGLTADQRTSFSVGWGEKLGLDLGLVLSGARDPARSRQRRGLHRHPDLEMQ
jgi:uncharacterized protein YndB with AHSA1/START domain